MTTNFDSAAVREIPASDIKAGDLVVGYVTDTGRRMPHADPYIAAPVPNDPACGCEGHQALIDEDRIGPLVVLTTGFPWDCCDVVPATTVILAIPGEDQ